MKEEIEAAVAWWCDVLRGEPRHDNGDAMCNAFTLLATTHSARPTSEQIEKFRSVLVAGMEREYPQSWKTEEPHWGSYGRTVDVDYHPSGLLRDAMEASGIQEIRFPIKTTMWVNPGEVKVRRGYGHDIETIYGAEMKPKDGGGR